MATRKPMTFDIEDKPAAATSPAAPAQRPSSGSPESEPRKSVGARVSVSLYRQAKAQAALTGITVQELLEVALRDYLAKTSH